jgi:uncharacterized protein
MQNQLSYLVQLQQLDKTIQRVLVNAKENPKKIEQISLETQEVEGNLKIFLQERDEIKKQRRDLEREVEALDEKIKKSQVKLMEVKTNKEYRAMLTEIDESKKNKVGKEDLLLEFLERLEEGVEKEKVLKKALETNIAEAKLKKADLEQKAQGFEKELTRLERERKDLTALIESALLRQYEFLRDRLKGVAVAEAKEASCLSCHMQIPPQMFNELHRQDRIITCPSCLRILYLSGPKEAEGE